MIFEDVYISGGHHALERHTTGPSSMVGVPESQSGAGSFSCYRVAEQRFFLLLRSCYDVACKYIRLTAGRANADLEVGYPLLLTSKSLTLFP